MRAELQRIFGDYAAPDGVLRQGSALQLLADTRALGDGPVADARALGDGPGVAPAAAVDAFERAARGAGGLRFEGFCAWLGHLAALSYPTLRERAHARTHTHARAGVPCVGDQ